MKQNNKKKGFTLVELVIVIAVIAILAGVMIATFSNVVSDAKESAAMQEAKSKIDAEYIDFITKNPGEVPASIFIGVADGKVTNVAFSSNPDEPEYIKLAGEGDAIVILTLGDESLVLTWTEAGYTLETQTDVTARATNATAATEDTSSEQP